MSKYSAWTKEALIAHIASLEGQLAAASKQAVPGPQLASLSVSGKPGSNAGAEAAAGTGASNSSSASAVAAGAPKKKKKEMDFSKFFKRKVAIRFAYLGWNYHGLAFQKDNALRTVEGEVLSALYKTRCIPSMDPVAIHFSRCGRTDADVSAMAQVISLDLRSLLSPDEQCDPELDSKELDYLKILNSHLPPDILAYQISLRPPPFFDARFNCLSRLYHYYFVGTGLNVEAMQAAAAKLIGEHDFRNFCKIDGSKQITNFSRSILEAEIVPASTSNMYYLRLRGTAFLWNQVRSIMAILFLVGQGLEAPAVVDRLLDVEATPRRPAYEIAWGVPLVLYDCEFAGVEWTTSSYTSTESLYNVWHEYFQKQSMARTMLNVAIPSTLPPSSDELRHRINVGHGLGKRAGRYTPVFERPLCETPEVVNRKWLERKSRKEAGNGEDDGA